MEDELERLLDKALREAGGDTDHDLAIRALVAAIREVERRRVSDHDTGSEG